MAGIDRDRREDREDLVLEALVEVGELVGRELVGLDEHDARRAASAGIELGVPAACTAASTSSWARGADRRELLVRQSCRRAATSPTSPESCCLQAGDAHHEELVEVRRDDREELEALEERHLGSSGLGEDARVELEPRELAVEVESSGESSAGTAGGRGDRLR